MSLAKALAYFFREAVVNLARSWKVSLLAVLTIAVSLFVGGAFWLVSGNLDRAIESWRQQNEVVVYLTPNADQDDLQALAAEVARTPWVTAVEAIDQRQAKERFARFFPSLADLAEGWGDDPLPASVEIELAPSAAATNGYATWLEALRQRPEVVMVDDDREWLRQLETAVAVARGLGLALGLVLLGAAIFTIASVVRLTAYLYRDEIAVMRLVGATEFFIRGPFYAEGLLQGLAGGVLATLGLYIAFLAVAPRAAATAWGALATGRFLSLEHLAVLLLAGGVAGLLGAIASLRREKLGTD